MKYFININILSSFVIGLIIIPIFFFFIKKYFLFFKKNNQNKKFYFFIILTTVFSIYLVSVLSESFYPIALIISCYFGIFLNYILKNIWLSLLNTYRYF